MKFTEKIPWEIWTEFFLLSAVSLFLELFIIRWMSSEIRAFSVFKTFPLVACFIGLGAGYAVARVDFFKTTTWAMLFFVAIIKITDFLNISLLPFPSFGVFAWKDVVSSTSNIWPVLGVFLVVLPFLVLAPFALMLCLGARLGLLFNEFKPLPAYCVNIGGAIFGGLAFSLLSFYCLSPGILLLIPGLMIVWYVSRINKRHLVIGCLAVLISAVLASNPNPTYSSATTYWSPYQRIDFAPLIVQSTTKDKQLIKIGDCLFANKVLYQTAMDWQALKHNLNIVDPSCIKLFLQWKTRFEFPFYLQNPRDILIVGAGLGNDVAQALKNNVSTIDAVDIDPVILRLGKLYHPLHPYDSPKVKAICNDARNFFSTCNKQYDMIILSHLDSLAVTAGSSLRLDNFVYTKQSIVSIVKLLRPNGIAIASFYTTKPWFHERLYNTIHDAIGYEPLEFSEKNTANTVFVFGPAVKNGLLKIPSQVFETYDLIKNHASKDMRLLTDDWPYLYVTPNVIDVPYLLIAFEVTLLALFIGKTALRSSYSKRNWQMFFLGAAFMLLELQAISRLSVLFGATWITTAIVINGILIMILAANGAVIKFGEIVSDKVDLLYALLLLSLLCSYILPYVSDQIMQLLSGNGLLVLITTLTLLPVLLASVIFAISFSRLQSPKDALAMNLFGAFLGGMLEYLSNYTGINHLTLLVAILYICSFVAFRSNNAAGTIKN